MDHQWNKLNFIPSLNSPNNNIIDCEVQEKTSEIVFQAITADYHFNPAKNKRSQQLEHLKTSERVIWLRATHFRSGSIGRKSGSRAKHCWIEWTIATSCCRGKNQDRKVILVPFFNALNMVLLLFTPIYLTPYNLTPYIITLSYLTPQFIHPEIGYTSKYFIYFGIQKNN